MKKRLVAVVMAAAVILAIPVAASAQESEEAPKPRTPISLEDRFETVEDAIAAITERMTSILDRVNERFATLEEKDDVPDEVFERISAAIDRVEASLAAVGDAEDFDELSTVMQEVREDRRDARAERRQRRMERRQHFVEDATAATTP